MSRAETMDETTTRAGAEGLIAAQGMAQDAQHPVQEVDQAMGRVPAQLSQHDPASPGRLFRRRVFYIPGYDPIHPRRYRELYRKEGAAQAALSGYQIGLQPKRTGGRYGWTASARIEGGEATADVEVLVWSDIVRQSMAQGILATYLQLIRTAWAYIGSGALFRLMRLRKGPMIAALYPIVMLLGQLALACLAGWLVGAWTGRLAALWLPAAAWAGLLPGLLVVWGLLRWFRSKDHRLYAYYLMHDYAYGAQSGGANPPELEVRMAEFGAAIRAALEGDYDEVLVVGHSSGAHLGVSILSDLIRTGLPGGAGEGAAALGTKDAPETGAEPAAGTPMPAASFASGEPEVACIPDAADSVAETAADSPAGPSSVLGSGSAPSPAASFTDGQCDGEEGPAVGCPAPVESLVASPAVRFATCPTAAAAPATRPALAFLSLGQVVPMVSFLPRATRLRGDLHYLSARDELTWIDVTAPGDGCAFALCDPVAVSGVAPPEQKGPLVISAAFTQTLSPARWKELRWRFFRLHFQYLCAFDALSGGPGDYDYFRITAGPQTLAARYAGRQPSKSRIDRAVNRFTTMA